MHERPRDEVIFRLELVLKRWFVFVDGDQLACMNRRG